MVKPRKNTTTRKQQTKPQLTWQKDTELLGLVFELSSTTGGLLPIQYTVGFHAWFLDQIRQIYSDLSAYLHDGESEKAFTISQLHGELIPQGRELQLLANQTYHWYITALSQRVVQGLAKWMKVLPTEITLRQLSLKIISCQINLTPTTYAALLTTEISKTVNLSFVSPTSFRRKGHHFPLPMPVNLFHSYLRRWNDFSGTPFNQEEFLDWIDIGVIIHRHELKSIKVQAGKQGAVTGFTGAIALGLSSKAQKDTQLQQLFYTLCELAVYCGTGHKTTFGLGETRKGWLIKPDAGSENALTKPKESIASPNTASLQTLLATRITELTEIFLQHKKRTGGNRAIDTAELWATILARRELGESLIDIAADLNMRYETVKTYTKLARRALRTGVEI